METPVSPETLVEFVHRVSDALRQQERRDADTDRQTGDLTNTETEILRLIAKGYKTNTIADIRSTSPETVKKHRANITAKLGKSDDISLAKYAMRIGLINKDTWANDSADN